MQQLETELTPDHPLHGFPVTAVLGCEGCEDVIFSVETCPLYWVRVHFTRVEPSEGQHQSTVERVAGPLYRSLADHQH